MAVDNLPCEFPAESSGEFSHVLKKFVKEIADTDFKCEYNDLELSQPIKKGLILHRGEFTPGYEYMKDFL